jgi:plasmid stabilization system protein ParE
VAALVWLPEALDDIERLYAFLAGKNAEAARNAVLCIKAAAQQLEQFPLIGRRMDDETERREIFAAFGAGAYVLRYRPDAQGNVVVIRVWHSRELRQET